MEKRLTQIINMVRNFLFSSANREFLTFFFFLVLSTIFWLIALSKKELSFVYPFISLTYVLVLMLSSLVLKEDIGLNQIAGTLAIIIGLIIISRS